MNYIKVKANRISHSGGEFFTFILNTEQLLKIAYVSVDERERGVQRPLSEKRCKDVAKYIDREDSVFANNIILNLSKESYFEMLGEDVILNILDEEKSAWVVDGQHRLFGFEFTDKKYEMLCSAFINLDVEKEAEIFVTINKEQKGISTSVIYDLIPLTKNADFKAIRAQSLVKQFNEDDESPWYQQIRMLGVGKGLITQATFAKNIEKLVEPNGGAFAIYNETDQYGILKNYFIAFKATFPEAWGNNKHILTKSVGVSAMCGILPKVLNLCDSDYRLDKIIEVLKNIESFDFSSETRGGSTNKVAINSIISELLSELPDVLQKKGIRY